MVSLRLVANGLTVVTHLVQGLLTTLLTGKADSSGTRV